MSELLNLDVNVLFEKQSVSEVENVNKKLKQEIERKKEELRTMVGERYRDLLKAADTINNMKQTSSDVIMRIDEVSEKCRLINEKQLIGFKSEAPPGGVKNNPKQAFYSIAIQVKILTIVSEMIWTHLDNDEYFLASQLFIFARHINTGLKLDTNRDVLVKFLVAKHQWDVLSQFFFIIKNKCIERLEMEDLSSEVASKCMASLILLDSCDMETVLKTLLKQQTKTFQGVLMDKAGKHKKSKDKILASLNVLNHTLVLLFECFVDCGDKIGFLVKELESLTSERSPYTISYIPFDHPKCLKYVPDIISKYKPNLNFKNITLERVQSVIKDWLESLRQIATTDIRDLVNLIGSVKVIHDIKHKALSQEKSKKWNDICIQFGLPENLDFYREFYLTLVNQRVKSIIQSNWDETLSEMIKDIDEYLESNPDPNMHKYVWSEESTDVPLSLAQALNPDPKTHKLLMKSLGFVPGVVQVCSNFDKNLQALYQDVDNYLNKEADMKIKPTKESDKDKQDLIEFLIQTSEAGLRELVKMVKQSKKVKSIDSSLKLARFLQALGELCPNLKLCLTYRSEFRDSDDKSSIKSYLDTWERNCKYLAEESLAFWESWSEGYFNDWKSLNRSHLLQNASITSALHDFGSWEIIPIEEKDEQENSVQSTIKIPSQASFPLQRTLFLLASDLNNLAPQTIPSSVVSSLTETVILEVLTIYEEINHSEFVKSNQNVSLQYYFDTKLLALMFISRDHNRKGLVEKSQAVANNFKAQIDPFDFELFFRYLNENIKKAVVRLHNVLGSLIPNMDHLMTIVGNQATTKVQEREPNVLTLSSTDGQLASWFPLLPIANPAAENDDKELSGSGLIQ